MEQYEAGRVVYEDVAHWVVRLLNARLAVAIDRAERGEACKEHLESMRELEKITKSKFDAGRISRGEHQASVFFRKEAEVLLFEEEAKPKETMLKLHKELAQQAQSVFDKMEEYLRTLCRVNNDPLREWQDRILTARLRAATDRAERVAACKQYLEYCEKEEKESKAMLDAGRIGIAAYLRPVCFRQEAAIRLLKEEAK